MTTTPLFTRPDGAILAAGETYGHHVVCAGFAVRRIIERFGADEIFPDDVFLLNDPYLAAIHNPDVYVIAPIHYEDALVGWSATFVHVSDVGAMTPGGDSPDATEIFQEGFRIPGIKLVERGKLRRDVFEMITRMTRQPDAVALDLKCEIAANNVAKARILAMCRQYGPQLMQRVSAELINHTERVLRRRLSEVPDGEWREKLTIEADGPCRLRLVLRKQGDRLTFDFTGTDPQARKGVNLPFHGTFGFCFGAVLYSIAYDLPKNQGILAPLDIVAPEGTLVNVAYPGPISMSTTSSGFGVGFLASSVLMQMLATSDRWCREIVAPSASHRNCRHSGVNQYGRYMAFINMAHGAMDGNGARIDRDGVDSGGSYMSCPNVEWMELQYPLLYLFRRHAVDSAGAGRFRGGVAVESAHTLHDAPEAKIRGVAYRVAGLENSGHGMFGGYPGAPSVMVLMEKTRIKELLAANRPPIDLRELGGKETMLSYCNFELRDGDVLYMRVAAGGGYGDPLERAPQRVRHDVLNSIVSPAAAREIYGVALFGKDFDVDSEATRELRSRPRRPEAGRGVASRPLRENLEIAEGANGRWIRCTRCQQALCREAEDWRAACKRNVSSPTRAGPLMKVLEGRYVFERLYCPSCGVLLNAEMVEGT
ncbi:MAG TPA: hydantoinase B/oxoprolinase family protein [candidate division Zixibacteria bacterium]|nr:hydantoinase B/oxoprolinase family protein [candidate division Zixibacteria bacterium]